MLSKTVEFPNFYARIKFRSLSLIHICIYMYNLLSFSHSVVSDSVTPWTAACQASLSFTISWSFLRLMSIESVMPSNHLILCRPLRLLPSIFPSIRVFSNELALCIRWPKYWSFSFSTVYVCVCIYIYIYIYMNVYAYIYNKHT